MKKFKWNPIRFKNDILDKIMRVLYILKFAFFIALAIMIFKFTKKGIDENAFKEKDADLERRGVK